MASSRKNKSLHIDAQAVSALSLAKCGLLYPVTGLMNSTQSQELARTRTLQDQTFPFPFILTPSGKRNIEILQDAQPGEWLDLFSNEEPVGSICVEEVFEIDKTERLKQIYGTDNLSHPGVQSTAERLGPYAISGEYTINQTSIKHNIDMIHQAKARIDAKHTTAIMVAANPLHRGHERLIRQALETTDLLVLFLLKPFSEHAALSYEVRYEILNHFISN